MKFHTKNNSKIMALSIMILCIVFMTSLTPVTSSDSSSLSSDSAALLDFGFSRLLDDLVSANDDSVSRKAMSAILLEVQNQSKTLGGSDEFINEIVRRGMKYNEHLDHYYLGIHEIDVLYNSMKEKWYTEDETSAMEELKCFSWRCYSMNDGSISTTLFRFRELGILTNKNLMEFLIEYMDIEERSVDEPKTATANDCWIINQSQQYKIHKIYHRLVILVAKGYAMMIYAIYWLKEHFRNNQQRMYQREKYEKTIRYFQKSAVSAMKTASRDILSCRLHLFQEGPKFIELKWLFNTIVTNEAYLNEHASCWKTCADYQDTTFYQYAAQPLEELNICHGRIYNCFQQTVDSYCPAERNFSRFESLHPTKMGRMSCSPEHDISNKVSNGAFDVCEQCICYCDDYKRNDTVRTFSLKAVESDTSKNRVITGIQFIERNRMIYLRIQEGNLKPHGIIEKSTIKWQPVHEFDHKSSSASPDDFFTITYDKKFVNLDTLVAPAGQVLTGIKLSAQGSHLALEIKTHAFNSTTGLLGNGSHFVTGKNNIPRQEISMIAPDSPIYMNQSIIDTRENTYVTFRMTDLGKDAGQTAIPFIDARPVVSSPPVPFSGAGIYYSGQTGYGGFIGLKAVAYNLSEFIGN